MTPTHAISADEARRLLAKDVMQRRETRRWRVVLVATALAALIAVTEVAVAVWWRP